MLGEVLALARMVVADEALCKGDAEDVAEVETVVFKERVVRPLLLAVLLALAQLEAAALRETVVEPLEVIVDEIVVFGEEEAVPDTEEERVVIADGEALGDNEVVVVADRLIVGVVEPEGVTLAHVEADAVAQGVEKIEGLALLEKESEEELLAQ